MSLQSALIRPSGTFSHLQGQTGEGPFYCLLPCGFAWEKVPDRADEGSY